MGVDHLGLQISMDQLLRMVRREAIATMQHAAFGRGGLRVYGGGFITIENGGLDVEGTATVAGVLTGNGTFDWWGPSILRGTVNVTGSMYTSGEMGISGALTVAGSTLLNGAATLNNNLTLGTGRIVVGNLVIQKAGGFSGQLLSSGILYLQGAGIRCTGSVYMENHLDVVGDLNVQGSKNFKMPHPTKPDHWLRHGSTESPVSGTEYTGRATIGEDGSVEVELPEYFEALNKPDNRTVQITPVGRPFPVGADEVSGGRVTVYGDPGRDVFWLVKAERFGGDFLLEEEIPPEPFNED